MVQSTMEYNNEHAPRAKLKSNSMPGKVSLHAHMLFNRRLTQRTMSACCGLNVSSTVVLKRLNNQPFSAHRVWLNIDTHEENYRMPRRSTSRAAGNRLSAINGCPTKRDSFQNEESSSWSTYQSSPEQTDSLLVFLTVGMVWWASTPESFPPGF